MQQGDLREEEVEEGATKMRRAGGGERASADPDHGGAEAQVNMIQNLSLLL